MSSAKMKHKAEHLKKGCVCPFCGDDEFEGGSVDINGVFAQQECSCTLCNGVWIDEYKLSRVLVKEEPHVE